MPSGIVKHFQVRRAPTAILPRSTPDPALPACTPGGPCRSPATVRRPARPAGGSGPSTGGALLPGPSPEIAPDSPTPAADRPAPSVHARRPPGTRAARISSSSSWTLSSTPATSGQSKPCAEASDCTCSDRRKASPRCAGDGFMTPSKTSLTMPRGVKSNKARAAIALRQPPARGTVEYSNQTPSSTRILRPA
jgi:hypothetical protein